MTISSYQVSNILRNYQEQLKFKKVSQLKSSRQESNVKDEVSISVEGKRQLVIKSTANQVVEKLTRGAAGKENPMNIDKG